MTAADEPAVAVPFAPDEVDLVRLDRAFRDALRQQQRRIPLHGQQRQTALSEQQRQTALSEQRRDELPVVGYGEISVAFAWPPEYPSVVAKSLPPFPDARRYEAYVGVLDDYLDVLAERGVDTVPTAVRAVSEGDRRRAYVLQPRVPTDAIGSAVLARAGAAEGEALLEGIVARVLRASDENVGIDGQVSNWTTDGTRMTEGAGASEGALRYLDVSTPMLRCADGSDRLDTELFVDAVPWVLRRPVNRFVAPELLSPYHDPRRVVLDSAGNLLRERLTRWIPSLLRIANPYLDPPLTMDEVRRFYRGNARTWSTLQFLRRVDRRWQTRVRRREYPFLLPASYRR